MPLFWLAIIVLAATINVSALRFGEAQPTLLRRLAYISGGLGIFFMLCVPISLLYALGSYMIGPTQDTSIFLNGALIGSCACTLSSLGLSLGIWRRHVRPDA